MIIQNLMAAIYFHNIFLLLTLLAVIVSNPIACPKYPSAFQAPISRPVKIILNRDVLKFAE